MDFHFKSNINVIFYNVIAKISQEKNFFFTGTQWNSLREIYIYIYASEKGRAKEREWLIEVLSNEGM